MQPRIILTPVSAENIDFIADMKTTPGLRPFEPSIQTDRYAVRKKILDRIGKGDRHFIVCLDDSEKTPIGEFRIHWGDEERKTWEIGYCVLPEYRRRGYCTEAAEIALSYAFDNWGAHRVFAMCNEHNAASRRVMEKIGMTKEGVFRGELPWNGAWADQYFYAILDYEYENKFTNKRTGAVIC